MPSRRASGVSSFAACSRRRDANIPSRGETATVSSVPSSKPGRSRNQLGRWPDRRFRALIHDQENSEGCNADRDDQLGEPASAGRTSRVTCIGAQLHSCSFAASHNACSGLLRILSTVQRGLLRDEHRTHQRDDRPNCAACGIPNHHTQDEDGHPKARQQSIGKLQSMRHANALAKQHSSCRGNLIDFLRTRARRRGRRRQGRDDGRLEPKPRRAGLHSRALGHARGLQAHRRGRHTG